MSPRFAIVLATGTLLSLVPLPAGSQATAKKASEPKIESQEPVKAFGEKGTKWTDTTVKAATRQEHKEQLDSGRAETIKGQLVEFSCYMQLRKADPGHVPCGTDCIKKNGQMVALLDENNDLYVVLAEEHDPRRNGQTTVRTMLVDYLHKPVSITGLVTQHDGVKTIFVKTLEPAK